MTSLSVLSSVQGPMRRCLCLPSVLNTGVTCQARLVCASVHPFTFRPSDPSQHLTPSSSGRRHQRISKQTGTWHTLKSIFPISNRTSSPLVWLEGGNNNKSLLTVVGMEHVLYYRSIMGNTDAAIITRASNDCLLPNSGLRILFDLKKPEKMDKAAVFQAAAQIVWPTCSARTSGQYWYTQTCKTTGSCIGSTALT